MTAEYLKRDDAKVLYHYFKISYLICQVFLLIFLTSSLIERISLTSSAMI